MLSILNFNKLQTELTIIVNSVCNLNCCECQTFCSNQILDNITTIYQIKNYLPIINNFFNIKKIVLLGGEPLLYPNLIEICQYLRKNFKTIEITILSNGLNFKNMSLLDYNIYKKLNITFEFSLYPITDLISNIKMYEQNLNIDIKINNIRPIFNKITFNKYGLNNSNQNFLECSCSNIDPLKLYMFQDKLFKCCLIPKYPLINLPLVENDYLNLNNLNKQNIIQYLNNSLSACKYCGSYELNENNQIDNYNADDIIFWHPQSIILSDFFHNLLWYYLYDYDKYYIYCHDCKNIINLFQDEYYLSKNNTNDYFHDIINILQIRFFKGEKDIFIPFSKQINEQQFIKLKNIIFSMDNFLKLNFYFVSIDKDIQTKRKFYKTFTPFSKEKYGNFYFLESDNISNGYNIFLNNSYLKEKITLNIQKND